MKKIKIYFVDFWPGFDTEDNFILSALQNRYEIVLDKHNPEYLFCSWNGIRHFKYKNAVKIYFTGENDAPNFNLYDYAIGSTHLHFGKRYFRFPLYVLHKEYDRISAVKNIGNLQIERKFCNFVYSNSKMADPARDRFFYRLSQYKKVDSGGRHLNNIGEPVADKSAFIKDYKFTIAFENSSLSGYTTEKLIDPIIAGSMPVYWGNPDVALDFNTRSFVNCHDYNSMDEVIDEIIYLDKNDGAYLEKLSQPWIINPADYKKELSVFLENILETPLSQAKQTTDYGWVRLYKHKQLIGAVLCENKLLRPVLKKIIR